jgi:hypothetical protein
MADNYSRFTERAKEFRLGPDVPHRYVKYGGDFIRNIFILYENTFRCGASQWTQKCYLSVFKEITDRRLYGIHLANRIISHQLKCFVFIMK